MNGLTDSEKAFWFLSGLPLIPHPFIIGGLNYRPDFYCPKNGSFYEVCTGNYSRHISHGHLDGVASNAPTFLVQNIDNKLTVYQYITDEEPYDFEFLTHMAFYKECWLKEEITKYGNVGGNELLMSLMLNPTIY